MSMQLQAASMPVRRVPPPGWAASVQVSLVLQATAGSAALQAAAGDAGGDAAVQGAVSMTIERCLQVMQRPV